jgi:DnaK suppressor protein
MTKQDTGPYRERLLALRARLQGDMAQMAHSALSDSHATANGVPTDPAEQGSDNFAQEMTLSLLGSERTVLDQIESALKRIDLGSFGTCEECGKALPEARLEAIPYAALCVRCTSRQEQESESR